MFTFPVAFPVAGSITFPTTGRPAYLGGSALSKLLQLPTPDPAGKINIGLWTDAREDDIEILDHDGIYRTIPGALNTKVPGGVVPIAGGRVVQNLIANSEDFTEATWIDDLTLTKVGFDASVGAMELSFGSNANAQLRQQLSMPVGTTLSRSNWWVRTVSGTSSVRIVTANLTSSDIAVNETWQRLDFPRSAAVGGSSRAFCIKNNAAGDTSNIYLSKCMIEDVTKQSNQNPGEYQKTDAANGFYGLAYYATENGNTVSGNVVTEAVGADISPAPTLVHRPASTNVFLNSTAPVTQTITLSATGSWTTSVAGAGSAAITANTATGTGFGSATEGVDVTVNITSTGSVDVTIADPLDWVQLENLAFSTPPIETAGVAVSRDAVSIGHPVTGVIKDAGGVLHIRLTPAFAQSDLFAINGVVSLQNATPFSLLYARSAGLRSTDGINTASVNPAFVANAEIEIAVRWSAALGELQIGYNDGSWTWGSAVAYAGVFVQDTRLNMFYGLSQNATISLCDIYGADMGTAAIEAL